MAIRRAPPPGRVSRGLTPARAACEGYLKEAARARRIPSRTSTPSRRVRFAGSGLDDARGDAEPAARAAPADDVDGDVYLAHAVDAEVGEFGLQHTQEVLEAARSGELALALPGLFRRGHAEELLRRHDLDASLLGPARQFAQPRLRRLLPARPFEAEGRARVIGLAHEEQTLRGPPDLGQNLLVAFHPRASPRLFGR